MTEDPNDQLTEEEATEVLRRAAELHAEASLRHETRGEQPDIGSVEGTDVGIVRSSAIEAGIDPRFVDAALADVRAERSLPGTDRRRSLARRFFGTLLDAVTVRRTIQASASDVLAAILQVFPNEPYRLALADRHGDPLDGGAVVFDVQGIGDLKKPWLAKEASMSAVRQVWASIRPLSQPPSSCEVTLRGPIAWSHNIGLVHGLVVSGLSGGVGALGLGAAGAMVVGGVVASPFVIAVSGLAGAIGLASGAALGRKGYRRFCRYGIERAARALDRMLLAIALQVEEQQSQVSPDARPFAPDAREIKRGE